MKKLFNNKILYRKNMKTIQGDQRYSTWLSEQKTNKFIKLYKLICAELGCVEKAVNFVGLSNHTRDDLAKRKITYETALKILNSFKKLKAIQPTSNLQRN